MTGESEPHRCSRRQLGFAGFCAVAAALSAPRSASAAAIVGAVSSVDGTAFARLGATRSLRVTDRIFLGDLIWTQSESYARLGLGDATRVDLGENTRLTIDRYIANAGGLLVLGSGAMMFDRPDEASKIDLRIRTDYGMIGVRGTEFFAGPSRGVFGVFVSRGRIAVTAGGETRVLSDGEGIDIAYPGGPPSYVRLWPGDRVREAILSVRG